MNQLGKKDIIHHYLLNLFTILNVELSNLNISSQKKKKIDNLISTASILISNENIFLNNKPELFIQDVYLKEVIDITCSIFSNRTKNIKLSPLTEDVVVKVDKYYFGEAFKYLFEEIIQDSTKIEFKFIKNTKILQIIHNKKTKFKEPFKDFSEYLKTRGLTKEDITFQLACAILKIHKIKLKLGKNIVELQF